VIEVGEQTLQRKKFKQLAGRQDITSSTLGKGTVIH
jgi:hypothetical protein